MNCTIFQRRLLTLENPRRLPADLQGHLALCASCRAWQCRLVELERRVPLLPVPASAAKDSFLGRILSGEAVPRREPTIRRPLPAPIDPGRRERRVLKVARATALAAGLVMFAVIIGAMRMQQQSGPDGAAAPDPLLATLLNRDLHLAGAPAKSGRCFRELADLAEDLRGQAEPLARSEAADDLRALTGWYRQVVREGVVALRPAASGEDRSRVANQLEQAREKAEQLAAGMPADCAAPLRDLAAAAEDAARSLQPAARSSRPVRGEPVPLALVGGRGPVPACIPAVALASIARAPSSAAQPTPAKQAERFRRNRGLIEKLVSGGLRLANEDNPVERAACCNGIAQGMAEEMRLAAKSHEGDRVAELGKHLQSLLEGGVAHNLGTARQHILSGSAEEPALFAVRDSTDALVEPLLRSVIIDAAEANDIRKALDSVDKAAQAKP